VLPSRTIQSGLEISLPDFLPLTLSVISYALFSLWWISALDMTFNCAHARYGFARCNTDIHRTILEFKNADTLKW
jgi:hypothetical protein